MNSTQSLVYIAALMVLSFGGGLALSKLIQRWRT